MSGKFAIKVFVAILVVIMLVTFVRFEQSKSLLHELMRRSNLDSSFHMDTEADMVPKASFRFNSIVTDYDPTMKAMLKKVVDMKLPADHPDVVSLVRKLVEPPSEHLTKTVRPIVETDQSREIMKILKNKKKGFYIEVGGLDGERGSNTLWLENKKQWSGLLIEMDPYFYTMLKGHSRNAWTINCCLSPYNYSTVMEFKESAGGGGQLLDPDNPAKDNNAATKKVIGIVPCFPLTSILLAIKQTKIDYFSLDIEGFELDILRTVPFRDLDISTLSVEFVHGRAGKQAYLDFMSAQGYDMTRELHEHDHKMAIHLDDFIFVKRGLGH